MGARGETNEVRILETKPYPNHNRRADQHRNSEIDYYGVTFDHLVPADDPDPEVLQINIIEMEGDDGAYANKYLKFKVNPEEYLGSKVLAVPRCCQLRKGTQDRKRVNDSVLEREREGNGIVLDPRFLRQGLLRQGGDQEKCHGLGLFEELPHHNIS